MVSSQRSVTNETSTKFRTRNGKSDTANDAFPVPFLRKNQPALEPNKQEKEEEQKETVVASTFSVHQSEHTILAENRDHSSSITTAPHEVLEQYK